MDFVFVKTKVQQMASVFIVIEEQQMALVFVAIKVREMARHVMRDVKSESKAKPSLFINFLRTLLINRNSLLSESIFWKKERKQRC